MPPTHTHRHILCQAPSASTSPLWNFNSNARTHIGVQVHIQLCKSTSCNIKLGAPSQPLQSSMEYQWSRNLHLGPLALGVALAWTPTPSMPRADLCPGENQDHFQGLFRLVQEKEWSLGFAWDPLPARECCIY